jgi:hypothetical protein
MTAHDYDLAGDFAFYCNNNDVVTSQLGDRITEIEQVIAKMSLPALLSLRRKLRNSVRLHSAYGPDWIEMRHQAVSDQRQWRSHRPGTMLP